MTFELNALIGKRRGDIARQADELDALRAIKEAQRLRIAELEAALANGRARQITEAFIKARRAALGEADV